MPEITFTDETLTTLTRRAFGIVQASGCAGTNAGPAVAEVLRVLIALHETDPRESRAEAREPSRDSLFVYIVERGDEPDVYADRADAEEAAAIQGADENNVALVIEQMVFPPSRDYPTTREWLDELRESQEN